jgi:glycerophosphoryl diester phosphodiesterase
MNVFAHRGYSSLYPENTMTAFKKVEFAGSYGIELDVQLTKDGEVVIIHDERVDRTTNGTGFVQDFTLNEIKRLNAGNIIDPIATNETIPTFEEYCQWVKTTNLITNVELKTSIIYYKDIEKKVIAIIESHHLEDKIILSSFNHLSLIEAKRIAPSISTAALVPSEGLQNGGFYCNKYGFSYLHPDYVSIDDSTIKECEQYNVGVNVWTVNSIDHLEYAIKMGVSGIITNFPLECLTYLTQKKQKEDDTIG